MEVMIVGGGGGGGAARAVRRGAKGGGAGSGGMLEGTVTFNAGSYTVTIGAGGQFGTNEQWNDDDHQNRTSGSNSSVAEGTWGTATANGGGAGSDNITWYGDAAAGGNGGGGGYEGWNETRHGQKADGNQGDSNSLTGYGHNDGSNTTGLWYGGGGGGAAGDGGGATAGGGRANDITGSSVTYAAGGYAANGGQYNWGRGAHGGDNTGDGGQSAAVGFNLNGNDDGADIWGLDGAGGRSGNGGSGIVVFRYAT